MYIADWVFLKLVEKNQVIFFIHLLYLKIAKSNLITGYSNFQQQKFPLPVLKECLRHLDWYNPKYKTIYKTKKLQKCIYYLNRLIKSKFM